MFKECDFVSDRRSIRTSLPLKWHGGKHYLAEKIVSLFPSHTHYVEPFFGGGAVFFAKPFTLIDGHSEVVNDRFGELTNFWRVLQSPSLFSLFRDSIELVPFSKPQWQVACSCTSDQPVERAVAFFIRYRQSRQGLGKDFATMSRSRTRRGMNEQVSSWLTAIDGLDAAHLRLRRAVIFNEDAIDVIKREDHSQTLFYCDPPYVTGTRVTKHAYDVEMSDGKHGELLTTLASLQGKFVLSGYRNHLYDEHATRNAWYRVDIRIDNKASAKKRKGLKTESVWFNFDPYTETASQSGDVKSERAKTLS